MRLACPFCRIPIPEGDKNLMKRAAANDPVALFEFGYVDLRTLHAKRETSFR